LAPGSQQLHARTDVIGLVGRAVVVTLDDFGRLRLLLGANLVEQLADEAEGVDLIVVLAGREAQKLGA
jgi:hypothetical protein